MKNNIFDKAVSEKMHGHQSAVPSDAWDNINRRKKKRPLILLFLFTFLIIITGAIILHQYTDHKNGVAATTRSESPADKNSGVEKSLSPAPSDKMDESDDVIQKNKEQKNKEQESKQQNVASANSPVQTNAVLHKTTSFAQTSSDIIDRTKNESGHEKANRRHTTKVKPAATAIRISNADAEDEEDLISKKRKQRKYQTKNKTAVTTVTPEMTSADEEQQTATPKEEAENKTAVVAGTTNKDTVRTTEKENKATAKEEKKTPKRSAKKNIFIDAGMNIFQPVSRLADDLPVIRTENGNSLRKEYRADKVRSELQTSFSYSLSFRKNISAKWQIAAGFKYSVIKEKLFLAGTETIYTYTPIERLSAGPVLVHDNDTTTTSGYRIINAYNTYHFFSLPVSLQYLIAEKNTWSLSGNAGVVINLHSQYRNSIAGKPQQSGMTSRLAPSVTADLYGGIRLDKSFGRRIGLYASPLIYINAMKYRLPEVTERKYIHRAGLTFGLSYRIRQHD